MLHDTTRDLRRTRRFVEVTGLDRHSRYPVPWTSGGLFHRTLSLLVLSTPVRASLPCPFLPQSSLHPFYLPTEDLGSDPRDLPLRAPSSTTPNAHRPLSTRSGLVAKVGSGNLVTTRERSKHPLIRLETNVTEPFTLATFHVGDLFPKDSVPDPTPLFPLEG